MRTAFLSVMLLGFFTLLGCGKSDEPKSGMTVTVGIHDHDFLEGVWSIEAIDDGFNAGKTKPPHGRVQFRGDEMLVTLTKDDSGERMTFTLDESKSPSWITLTSKGTEPLVEEGIYRLEGDELTIARSPVLGVGKSPRPTDFQARAWKAGKLGEINQEPPVIVWRLKKTDEPIFTPGK